MLSSIASKAIICGVSRNLCFAWRATSDVWWRILITPPKANGTFPILTNRARVLGPFSGIGSKLYLCRLELLLKKISQVNRSFVHRMVHLVIGESVIEHLINIFNKRLHSVVKSIF
jgi:hypothetical protein